MEAITLSMQHKVAIMRNMLTSLSEENRAIKAGDEALLDRVMDERIDIMSAFEVQNRLFLTELHHLAVFSKEPCYLEALEILEGSLPEEEAELIALKGQLAALLKEIYTQNSINAKLLQDGEMARSRVVPFLILPKKAPVKTTVQLLDP